MEMYPAGTVRGLGNGDGNEIWETGTAVIWRRTGAGGRDASDRGLYML